MGSAVKSFFKWFVFLFVLLAIMAGGYFKLEEFSAQKVHEFTDKYSDLVRVEFDRALINPFDQTLNIWGIHCSFSMGSSFSVDRIVIDKFDREHSFPLFFKGSIEGISVPVDFMNLGPYAGEFRKMGYEELTFDLLADYIYEDETKRLTVKKLCFDGVDSLQVSTGFDLGDVKLINSGFNGLIGVSMLDGGMILVDKSLTVKFLDLAAAAENSDFLSYRSKLMEGMQLKMQKAKSLGNGFAENFYAEIIKFIAKPGKLVVRVEPTEPVPLLYMFMGRSFEELLELYGVTVESDELGSNAGDS
ncbi:hypothetical protein [Maridesulfovibrio zosterae]|uniref:hypothetical protein n=1 Tax=Maridesulfovibrio zosterae TaxID=82171 RepID=UPI00040D6F5E|nr:hypothetical protein [Maridesulfovibrio zosterae]